MAPIGPQLPSDHLKRKRTAVEEEDSSSASNRPSKANRSRNDEEIPLQEDSSSDDDGFGPPVARRLSNGIVAKLDRVEAASRNERHEINARHDDSDNTAIRPGTGPSRPARRIIGPAPPPADLSARPSTDPNADSDPDSGPNPTPDSDSDSDGYGPALPSASGGASQPARDTTSSASSAPAGPAAPQRDAWMLAPPTDTAYRAPDPTKLRARKFASGKGSSAGAGAGDDSGVSSIWTETPAEKVKRVADAVLGRGGDGAASSTTTSRVGKAQAHDRSKEREGSRAGGAGVSERNIRAHTESTRGKSLYEEHQAQRKAGKDGDSSRGEGERQEADDPSLRPFDKEKDMGLAQKISDTQRRDLLRKAADFGGRFSKGSYL